MEKTYNFGIDIVYSKCKAVLAKLEMKIESVNRTTGTIRASTPTSLLSWGEEITIKLKKVSETKTKVYVTSEATSQLISWGKNENNVLSIIEELSKRLK